MMKRATQTICAASAMLALSSIAQAQTPTGDVNGSANANGIVVGPGNTPQAGVPVQIVGPPGQTVAITDKDGKWSVYNLPAGMYKVKPVGTDNPNNANQVTFSVKEKSFLSKFMGGTSETVMSPEIQIESAAQ